MCNEFFMGINEEELFVKNFYKLKLAKINKILIYIYIYIYIYIVDILIFYIYIYIYIYIYKCIVSNFYSIFLYKYKEIFYYDIIILL